MASKITFVVLVACQVLLSSANPCCYSAPQPPQPQPCPIQPPTCSATWTSASAPVSVSAPAPAQQVYYSSSSAPSASSQCLSPTVVQSSPLTIPLSLPNMIPLGNLCACKTLMIKPSLVSTTKPCSCKLTLPPVQAPCPVASPCSSQGGAVLQPYLPCY